MKQSSCHFVGKNRVLPLQLNCKLYKNVLIRLMLCLNLNAVKYAKRKGTHFRVPFNVERMMGIEPTRSAWKAEVLPLNYIRLSATLSLYHAVWYMSRIFLL